MTTDATGRQTARQALLDSDKNELSLASDRAGLDMKNAATVGQTTAPSAAGQGDGGPYTRGVSQSANNDAMKAMVKQRKRLQKLTGGTAFGG